MWISSLGEWRAQPVVAFSRVFRQHDDEGSCRYVEQQMLHTVQSQNSAARMSLPGMAVLPNPFEFQTHDPDRFERRSYTYVGCSVDTASAGVRLYPGSLHRALDFSR